MPFEKCLHALIFPSETAALPLPQRRWFGSNKKIFTLPPQKSHMQVIKKKNKNLQSRSGDWLHAPSQKTQEVSREVSILGNKK